MTGSCPSVVAGLALRGGPVTGLGVRLPAGGLVGRRVPAAGRTGGRARATGRAAGRARATGRAAGRAPVSGRVTRRDPAPGTSFRRRPAARPAARRDPTAGHAVRRGRVSGGARATVAQLAANEERLRLARDLHDLLGHSLSLITLKSELAGRMLPDHPDKAARQVADIEQVSRQALVDVREAVTGYRRPRLAAELAGAQVALTAAGVVAEVPAEPDLAGVPEDAESALAWALREAVTNVVRHSGADRCVIRLLRRQTLDGPVLELSVEDDGSGGSGNGPGNGLTGLTERLEKAGGTLEAGRTRHGFRLLARAPAATAADVGSGA
ncbi:sensor histidine kinase [Streptomyces sp. FBKL.4005]|uniref:sensor histidine kinase n=1 Tax=Streptomyces sp. FBKL.4005 TaxID=2015515 RepID=UPI001CB9CB31|nr:histidine kinase [Streptomyces sp. FBKL.4005]